MAAKAKSKAAPRGRSVMVFCRVSPPLAALIKEEARKDLRDASGWIRSTLISALRAKGVKTPDR